jgi:hypothetical protein
MTDLGHEKQKFKVGVVGVTTGRRKNLRDRRSDDDFLVNILRALDMTALELAGAVGLTRDGLLQRYGSRRAMSDYDTDDFWPTLSELINTRIGGLMAVKEELDRKLRQDRRKRQERERVVRKR